MQAIFGNPLAEPGVIGISSGAAVGAGLSIVFGLTLFGQWTTACLLYTSRCVSETGTGETIEHVWNAGAPRKDQRVFDIDNAAVLASVRQGNARLSLCLLYTSRCV